jgi:hypothetical protein
MGGVPAGRRYCILNPKAYLFVFSVRLKTIFEISGFHCLDASCQKSV